jgi:hypothetical protein
MPGSPTFWHLNKKFEGVKLFTLYVQTAGSGKDYTLHVHARLLLVKYLLYDVGNHN